MSSAITRIIPTREHADCAVASIAMFADRSYEDVLRAVVLVDRKHHGREGLKDRQIRRVLAALGCPVRFRSRVDYDEDYGLLRLADHLALLRNGLIVEDDAIWDVDVWREAKGYQHAICVNGIFVAVEA